MSVEFLDVDLYQPTKRALEVLYEVTQPGGVILVDDVRPGGIYDGANAAYGEFCSAMGHEPPIVGTKAGAVHKPA